MTHTHIANLKDAFSICMHNTSNRCISYATCKHKKYFLCSSIFCIINSSCCSKFIFNKDPLNKRSPWYRDLFRIFQISKMEPFAKRVIGFQFNLLNTLLSYFSYIWLIWKTVLCSVNSNPFIHGTLCRCQFLECISFNSAYSTHFRRLNSIFSKNLLDL